MENVNLEQSMNKVYAVIEFGGEYEDKWQHIIAICSTPEFADVIRNKVEEAHQTTISEEEYLDALAQYDEEYPDDFNVDLEKLQNLNSKYSLEDWKQAEQAFDYSDWFGVEVKEIDFVDNQKNLEEWTLQ